MGNEANSAKARRRWTRLPLSAILVAALVCAVAAAGLGFLTWRYASDRNDLAATAANYQAQSADRAAGLAAGSAFLTAVYRVDAVTDKALLKWNDAVNAATTDTLREQLRQTKAILSMLTEAGATMTGAVTEAAIVSQNDTLVRLLAVVDLTGTLPNTPDPTTGSVTEYVDLMKVNGQWKVFGYQDIGAKNGAGQPVPGLPGLPAVPVPVR
ncbi:hypothetical protein AB0M22_13945 [Nocardia sp. NPDC051756]|uniref:hypothetical protein n=1 Tax=Nocardia sp. NPDC051756 TaxID=3154751 RepID=UPI003448AC7F